MSRYIVYEEQESVMYVEDENRCNFRRNGICYCNANIKKIGKKCEGAGEEGDFACIFYEKEKMKKGEIIRSNVERRKEEKCYTREK